MGTLLKVYLAGDISPDRWRLKVIEACKDLALEFLSPIDNVSYSYQSLIAIHKNKEVFHLADRVKVDESTVVFAYIKDGSPSLFSGTSWEMGYGKASGKVIILVNDMKPSVACKYELVKRMTDLYYTSLDEAIETLRELALEMGFQPEKNK
jgi:nucleoside 2-deoxyribosyltransferase